MTDLHRWEAEKEKILRYHWDLYSHLAYERRKMANQIRMALLEATSRPFEFQRWQRQVRYKYSLTPLSPKGSLIEPGGRFNIPDVNPEHIPPFPALYIAEDKSTTLHEAGQHGNTSSNLSDLDLALTRKDSISIVSLSGRLASIIDLHQPNKLKPLLKLVKGFAMPNRLVQAAKDIGLEPAKTIRSLAKLLDTLLEPNWRAMCMQLDIPANCQIFGQMVANTGIEGILYPSKYTKKRCLAVYPQNFDRGSFVALDGEFPSGTMAKLDADIWPQIKASW